MSFLLTRKTRDWLRDQMGRGSGFGARKRRISHTGGSSGDVMLAIIDSVDSNNVEPDGLYTVDLFPPGIDSAGNKSIATLALTDVCQGARLPAGTALLAHRVAVRSIVDGGDD